MADTLRCAVIGVGAIGLEHVKAFRSSARAQMVAIADAGQDRLEEAARLYEVPHAFTDYARVLERRDVDAVSIALPNYLHAKVAEEALRAGKHVLLEKPMATSYREACALAQVAKRSGKILMLAQNFRFEKGVQMAKAALERGEAGDLYHARGFWLRRSGIPRIGSWFTQMKYAGGGCIYDLGVHMIDLVLYLFDRWDVVSVSGRTHSKFGVRGLGEFDWGKGPIDPGRPCDVEDYGVALLKLKSGATIDLEIAWAAHIERGPREKGVDLFGTRGGLSLFPAMLYRAGSRGYETVELAMRKVPLPVNRMHYFVDCVREDVLPVVTLGQSLKVQQILDAIYASSASGREVRLGSVQK